MKKILLSGLIALSATCSWAQSTFYTPLEYIESVDAVRENVYTFPYKPNTNTKVEVKFWTDKREAWRAIFSARNVGAGTGMSMYINGDNAHIGYFTGGTTGAGDNRAPFEVGTIYTAECTVGNLKLNGTDYATGETTCNETSRNFTIFANPEWDNAFHGRIWYFKLSENGTPVCDYEPVMRNDGAFGFYDASHDSFVQANNSSSYTFGKKDGETYVYMTETSLTLKEGENGKLDPVMVNAAGESITWTSSSTANATVAADGTVTGVKEGAAVITGTSTSGWVVEYNVNVVNTTRATYTVLDYIESTGARRENAFTTNYKANKDTDLEIKFHIASKGGWRAIFSGRNGQSAGNGISLYQNGGNDNFGYFVGGFIEDNMLGGQTANSTHVVKASLARLDVDGESKNTNRTEFNASSRCISMFSNPEWDEPFRGKIYYMTIKEGETVVRDYKPAMRHDGVWGYYDSVTGHFVQPVENYNGYSYALAADKAYIYFPQADRTVIKDLTVKHLPETPNVDGEVTYVWTSSDESVATVAADGTVTGKKAGVCKIIATTAADGGWETSYELQVIEMAATRTDADGIGYMAVKGGDGYSAAETWDKTCDGNLDTKYCGGSNNAWVIMMASEPVAVKQYSFVTGGDTGNYGGKSNNDRNPKTFKLEGSNDMNNWTTIHEMNDAYYLKSLSKEEYVFQVNDATPYKFFKFSATNGRTNCVQFAEVWINEQPQTFGEPVTTTATCKASGSSKVTSNLGAVRTTFIPASNNHNFVDGTCSVCGQAATILAANGQDAAYTVKYKHAYRGAGDVWVADPANWTAVDFDDSDWSDLTMPIGSDGYDNGANNGAKYNTIWKDDYNNFWMRREFYINDLGALDTYQFKFLHDDDYRVYVNGTELKRGTGWTNGTEWDTTDVPANLLHEGKNVLAVYIQQNWGGAYCDFSLERTLVNTTPVTVSVAGYATYVAPFKVAAADGVEAYVVSSIENGYVTLGEVTEIPADAVVVLKATEGTHNLDVVRTDVAALGTNELQASATDVVADGTQYVLAQVDEKVGFHKVISGTTIAAGKGFIVVPAGAKVFLPFADDETATAIEGVIVEKLDGTTEIYNLQGQKIMKAQKGVNIINGKKVVIK